MSAGQGIWAA